jgi:nucleotide-binding universal stress UspA family protein
MKIIVTTDFSENSRSGLRMAAVLAQALHAELHFVHICFIPGKPGEDDKAHRQRVKQETDRLLHQLRTFVKPFLNYLDKKDTVRYHIIDSFLTESGILSIQKKIRAGLICLSTRGAGKLPKLLGTTAANLLTQSPVPVLIVPSHYRMRPLKSIIYFCDLENPRAELKKLLPFSKQLNIPIEMVYFTSQIKSGADESFHKMKTDADIRFTRIPMQGKSLTRNMLSYAEQRTTALIAMFTRQRKTFLQRLFSHSRAEELAFHTRTPLLVFHKK